MFCEKLTGNMDFHLEKNHKPRAHHSVIAAISIQHKVKHRVCCGLMATEMLEQHKTTSSFSVMCFPGWELTPNTALNYFLMGTLYHSNIHNSVWKLTRLKFQFLASLPLPLTQSRQSLWLLLQRWTETTPQLSKRFQPGIDLAVLEQALKQEDLCGTEILCLLMAVKNGVSWVWSSAASICPESQET